MSQATLIYEDHPDYAWWLKLVLGGPLILTLGLGIYFLNTDIAAAAVMFGVTIFDAILFRFLMPRSYQIYSDRLVIRLYGPFSKTVMLTDIKQVRPLAGASTLSGSGFKFTTSAKNVLEIQRHRGMYVTISPHNKELFLEQLDEAVKQIRGSAIDYRT